MRRGDRNRQPRGDRLAPLPGRQSAPGRSTRPPIPRTQTERAIVLRMTKRMGRFLDDDGRSTGVVSINPWAPCRKACALDRVPVAGLHSPGYGQLRYHLPSGGVRLGISTDSIADGGCDDRPRRHRVRGLFPPPRGTSSLPRARTKLPQTPPDGCGSASLRNWYWLTAPAMRGYQWIHRRPTGPAACSTVQGGTRYVGDRTGGHVGCRGTMRC